MRYLAIFLAFLLPVQAARNAANGCSPCVVDFGDADVIDTNGNETIAMWIKQGASNNANSLLMTNGCTTTGAGTNKIATIWFQPSATIADLNIGHQYSTFLSEIHTFDTNLGTGVWTFVAAARDTSAKTWTVWTATTGGLTQVESWAYTNQSDFGVPDANHHLTLFRRIACSGQPGTSFAQADDVSIGWPAIWKAVLTEGEISTYRWGRLPRKPDWISPLSCATTEPDWSGNANLGTNTSTTCTDNPPVVPLFAQQQPRLFWQALARSLFPALYRGFYD